MDLVTYLQEQLEKARAALSLVADRNALLLELQSRRLAPPHNDNGSEQRSCAGRGS